MKKEDLLKNIGVDIDKGKFCDYLAKSYKWFSVTLDEFFPELAKDDEPLDYRRIDHLMSDIHLDGRKIVLNIQKDDPFIDGAHTVITSMNIALRMKDDNKFFVLNEIDYI